MFTEHDFKWTNSLNCEWSPIASGSDPTRILFEIQHFNHDFIYGYISNTLLLMTNYKLTIFGVLRESKQPRGL